MFLTCDSAPDRESFPDVSEEIATLIFRADLQMRATLSSERKSFSDVSEEIATLIFRADLQMRATLSSERKATGPTFKIP